MPPVFKLKNIIAISKDSVFHSNNYYPKDSLKFILKTNLLNYGKNYKFADSPDRLIIKFLHPKQESMSDFENNLIEIFDSYNEIKKVTNDSLRLNIDFQEFIFLKPPPLPLVFEESE